MSLTQASEPRSVVEFLRKYAHGDHIASARYITLPGDEPPWRPTGLMVHNGQAYSLFADGLIRWSKRYPHLSGGPRFHLWARISPGGRAVNLTANSDTFIADAAGELELGIYMGLWADEFGALGSSNELYRPLIGELEIAVVLYTGDPLHALELLSRDSETPAALTTEATRLRSPYNIPDGWHYLHETGYATIFDQKETSDGRIVRALADNDQGILRHPVEFPLTPTTTLQWRWLVDEHPSTEPEDLAISHDYISVAAEFDNGRDLTWIWSNCLELGTYFQCPIRVWKERETHYVIRSHHDNLGQWYTEHRNVYDDVNEAMGPPPEKITAIWLIALSTFHHRIARASFARITLANKELKLSVI